MIIVIVLGVIITRNVPINGNSRVQEKEARNAEWQTRADYKPGIAFMHISLDAQARHRTPAAQLLCTREVACTVACWHRHFVWRC